MLTLAEQGVVQKAIGVAIAADGSARPFITATFGTRAQALLLAMPPAGSLTTLDQHAAFVLGQCLDARWPPPPALSLMEVMLTALIAGGDASLVPLRDRVHLGEASDPNPDPVKTLWVNDTMPFFSRALLRPVVKAFLDKDAQPILRIIGAEDPNKNSKSGKSYSRFLIDHVTRLRSDQRVLFAEVPEKTGPSYAIEELIDQLLVTLPHPNVPPRANSNYAAAVARWIVNTVLINAPGRSILVLDGFNQTDLLEETREVVRLLAQQIAGVGDVRKRLRLVLIDYDAAIPNVPLGAFTKDSVPDVATVTVADVEACLAAHYKDMTDRQQLPAPPAATVLSQTATGFVADAKANGALNLQALNDMLTQLRLDDLKP